MIYFPWLYTNEYSKNTVLIFNNPKYISKGDVTRVCVYMDKSFRVFHFVNKPKRNTNEDKLLSLDMGKGTSKVK